MLNSSNTRNMNRQIRILADADGISRAAAQLFIESASQAIAQRGRFLAALSGGNTPMGLYHRLAAAPERDQVDWSRTYYFWGDERCVPPDDAGSSYGQARQALLDKVPIPAHNIQRVESGLEPGEAARDYARRLREFAAPSLDWPRFDLVLLGMGDDGHTASLFPGSPVEVESAVLAVTAQYQDRPANRVTLTPPVFNAARRILFLVNGASKADTLAKVLLGDYHPGNLPAQRIDPTGGEAIWLVDAAAGSKLIT
jgi:6-phosphogluconolactonase